MALNTLLRYFIFTALVLFLIGSPTFGGESAETSVSLDSSESFDCDNDFRSAVDLHCSEQHEEQTKSWMEFGKTEVQGDEELTVTYYGLQKLLREGLTPWTLWESLLPYLKLTGSALICVFLPLILLNSWASSWVAGASDSATSIASQKQN